MDLATQVMIDSLEISKLVESRHDKVKQSIERLANRGAIQLPPLGVCGRINELGLKQKVSVYQFEGEQGKRDSIIVVAQLSPEFTARLVDRWIELEKKVRLPEYDSSESFISLEQAKIGIELLEASGRLLTLSKSETVHWLSGLHKAAGLPDFPSQLERNEPDSIQEAMPPAPTQQLALLVKPETSSLAALLREYNIDSPSASVFTMLYKHGFVERRFKASQLKNRGVKTKEGYWYLTEKGLYYGENANTSRERGETHPKFYDNRFGELLFQLGYIC